MVRVDAVRAALRASTARRRWVVTEGYFSMEGDTPDLASLRSICDEEDAALIVDEAHAIGRLRRGGAGLCLCSGARPDALVGTLGKALGAQGAFVAGSRDLCRWLWNRARSFVFSTGLSPLLAAIGHGAVVEAREDERGRRRLMEASGRFAQDWPQRISRLRSPTDPIIPLMLGEEARALDWSRRLAELGIRIQAIRPPTVPRGTSRLRIAARADLTDDEVDRSVAALVALQRDATRDSRRWQRPPRGARWHGHRRRQDPRRVRLAHRLAGAESGHRAEADRDGHHGAAGRRHQRGASDRARHRCFGKQRGGSGPP